MDGSGEPVQILFERNRRSKCRLAIGGIRRSNAALTHGARDKENHIPTRMPVCDRGVIGQQLSTIGQQFFSTLFLLDNNYPQLTNIFFSTLFLLDNNYPQLANIFFSTLFLLDNNYPQLDNNFWFSTLFLLDNNYPQLANNFSLLSFYWTTIIHN